MLKAVKILPLKMHGVKNSQRQNTVKRKLKQGHDRFAKHLSLAVDVPEQDLQIEPPCGLEPQDLINYETHLQEFKQFKSESSIRDKMCWLTGAPAKWSLEKVTIYFDVKFGQPLCPSPAPSAA